jgi:hypothetical protein
MTGNEIIIEALLLDHIIYPGQTISPEAQATSEKGLNMMLDEWNATGLAVYSVARSTFGLSLGIGSYSIGPGGTLGGLRPVKIDAWSAQSIGGGSEGGKPVDAATFASERAKIDSAAEALGLMPLTFASLLALKIKLLNYDAAFPTGNIHIYPLPAANGMTLDLWMWYQFTQVTNFALDIVFPPGYLKAILYNLAIDLAPKFGRPLDPAIVRVADQCKQALGATNAGEHSGTPVPSGS